MKVKKSDTKRLAMVLILSLLVGMISPVMMYADNGTDVVPREQTDTASGGAVTGVAASGGADEVSSTSAPMETTASPTNEPATTTEVMATDMPVTTQAPVATVMYYEKKGQIIEGERVLLVSMDAPQYIKKGSEETVKLEFAQITPSATPVISTTDDPTVQTPPVETSSSDPVATPTDTIDAPQQKVVKDSVSDSQPQVQYDIKLYINDEQYKLPDDKVFDFDSLINQKIEVKESTFNKELGIKYIRYEIVSHDMISGVENKYNICAVVCVYNDTVTWLLDGGKTLKNKKIKSSIFGSKSVSLPKDFIQKPEVPDAQLDKVTVSEVDGLKKQKKIKKNYLKGGKNLVSSKYKYFDSANIKIISKGVELPIDITVKTQIKAPNIKKPYRDKKNQKRLPGRSAYILKFKKKNKFATKLEFVLKRSKTVKIKLETAKKKLKGRKYKFNFDRIKGKKGRVYIWLKETYTSRKKPKYKTGISKKIVIK